MNKILRALGPKLVPVLYFLILPFSGILAQSPFGQPYQSHQHGVKCAANIIEQQQKEELGIFGTREYFESWIEDKKGELKKLKQSPSSRIMNEGVRRLPVVVHIIHRGEPIGVDTNIPDEQVYDQIRILNEDFQMKNPDFLNTPVEFLPVAASAGLEFVLAKQDPMGLPTTGINRVRGSKNGYTTDEGELIAELASWPSEEFLNIWVIPILPLNFEFYLGYATSPIASGLPGMGFNVPTRETDGVTVDYRFFGSVGNASDRSLGRTATHEMGHFLGLRHIWGDGDCSFDDFVADTPDQDGFNGSCNVTPRFSCESRDMVENFMDYTPDRCMSLFTAGQVERMDVVLAFSPRRNSLLTSRALDSPARLDLSMDAILDPGDFLCGIDVFPQVRVINLGLDPISEAVVEIRLNGVVQETKAFDIELSAEDSTVLSFDQVVFSLTDENFFEAEIISVNGEEDEIEQNNRKEISPVPVIETDLPYFYQGHQNTGDWDIINPDNSITWEPLTLPIDGISQDVFYINSFNYEDPWEFDYLISPKFDLSEVDDAQLSFNLAHFPYDNLNFREELIIAVSTDCGNTFDLVSPPYRKTNESISTGDPTFSEFFPGTEDEFRREILDLKDYSGFSEVRIAFIVANGYGNNVFIKDIEINNEAVFRYELELTEITSPLPVTNGDQDTDSLLITNTGNLNVQNYSIQRIINSRNSQTFFFDESELPVGASTVVELPNLFREGTNRMDYNILAPNFDQNEVSGDSKTRYFVQDDTKVPVPWRQSFNQSDTFEPWIDINPEANDSRWRINPSSNGDRNLAVLDDMEQAHSYWLASPQFSLDSVSLASLIFEWTGGGFDPQGNTALSVLISTDGGISSTTVWEKTGAALNQVGDGVMPNFNDLGDFESSYINLNAFTGSEKVRAYFRVQNENDGNGVLFFNNIELFLSNDPDPVDPGLNNTVVYPNPAEDVFNITFNLESYENVNIQFISTTGQIAYDVDFPNTLNQTYRFSKKMLSKGLFIVKITGGSFVATKRLVIH